MNFEQLVYIVEIAKTGSIVSAANKLHVSQAGISKALSNLEAELKIKLFKRSRNGTFPTEEGKDLIKKAHEIVIKLEAFKEEAKIQTSLINDELKVSTTPGLFVPIIKTLPLFKKAFPNVNIEIIEGTAGNVVQNVKKNNINLGLVFLNDHIYQDENLEYEKMFDAQLVVSVNKNSPLAHRKTLTPHDLGEQSLVIYNGENMIIFVQELFKKYNTPMHILFKSNDVEGIIRTVVEDLAIGFKLDYGLRNEPYFQSDNIVHIPLYDDGPIIASFGWIRSKNQLFSISAKEFLKYFKYNVSNINW
ncbi:LysR family transcriptional regulator [Lentibacillus sp. Marseille-P4043]|uniref:LysR family transcriptional regulator n=1 Tax=Lentibacillus sp. Marseille-P4043 TaxID=2040293 RepID=UPI000D0B03DE|nr:LysR family transcriptional regulator [Lentibacillus sp. Marseille-P4043]